MSRADRLMNRHLVWNPERKGWDTDESRRWPHGPTACDDGREHRWQPVSFRFETQLLDKDGRVQVRQPDLEAARVYVVCMECLAHTYVETEWAGFCLGGPPSKEPAPEDDDDR